MLTFYWLLRSHYVDFCALWGAGPSQRECSTVFKVHRLLYHSTLGSRVIKKEEEECSTGFPVTASLAAEKSFFLLWSATHEKSFC